MIIYTLWYLLLCPAFGRKHVNVNTFAGIHPWNSGHTGFGGFTLWVFFSDISFTECTHFEFILWAQVQVSCRPAAQDEV